MTTEYNAVLVSCILKAKPSIGSFFFCHQQKQIRSIDNSLRSVSATIREEEGEDVSLDDADEHAGRNNNDGDEREEEVEAIVPISAGRRNLSLFLRPVVVLLFIASAIRMGAGLCFAYNNQVGNTSFV